MNRPHRALISLLLTLTVPVVDAHNAICSCFENADETITCEGGFSDGGKAIGVAMRVFDQAGKVLVEGAMGKDSTFSFRKPNVAYRVQFNGGEGHVITIDGRDIEK